MLSLRGAKAAPLFAVAALAGFLVGATPAQAQLRDLLARIGLVREAPPPPSPDYVSYEVEVDIVGGTRALERAVRDVSSLFRLQGDPPPDAEALVRRAEADLAPVIDALWGAGFYNARVAVEVAGVPLELQAPRTQAAVAAARPYRGLALVPVRIAVDPGNLFVLRDLAILDEETGRPLNYDELPPRAVRLEPGDPARSADILAAQARIVDFYRERSRPFAEVPSLRPVVFHPAEVMDLTMVVDPGPVAGIGPITVQGAPNIDPRVIRSFIYTQPGDPYSPAALASIRRSIQQLEAVAGVRLREAETLDEFGNLPLTLEVTERLPRAAGFSARYSTVDGPAVRAHWTHRNLFGGAERLRVEGNVFYLTRGGGRELNRGRPSWDDVGGRFSVSFLKPALGGTRNDLLADAFVERDRTEGYTTRLANATLGIRHRFGERFSVRGGFEVERGQTQDVLGRIDYTLVGLPLALEYDSTDSQLDPTRGWRVVAGVTPYPEFLGSTVGFVQGRATASTYLSLDEDGRYVLAARLGLGSNIGADLADIPANRRFFAGGAGSVRGFRYRSLGPQFLGQPIGGRSLLEASLEARIRVTDTIGIVPFVDAGTAFEQSYPDFREDIRVAAGLGLRYYTGIGPIRLDIAVPVNRQRGDRAVALYLGIGQAF